MTLAELQSGWDEASRQDAIGNILTDRQYSEEEFFESGREVVARWLERLDKNGWRVGKHERAMDFGCGLGRLSVALAEQYEQVHGVDVSSEMVLAARPHTRCQYHANHAETLPFGDACFDLIISAICLQHMEPELQGGYVREFARVLRPGGVAVFQLPSGPAEKHPQGYLSMYGSEVEEVKSWAEDGGAEVLDVDASQGYTGGGPWTSNAYTMRGGA